MWPTTLDSSSNTVVWDENGTTQTASLTTSQDYYAHNDTDSALPANALYDELITQMESSGADNYSVSSATPSGSEVTNGGLTVTNDTGNNWGWLFSDSNFDLDPRLLGYGSSPSDPSLATSQTGPRTVYSQWQSWSIFVDGNHAIRKSDDQRHDLATSSDKAEDAFQLQYGPDRIVREWVYHWIPAAHVRKDKANRGQHADNAGLASGDTNNQWADLHDRMADLDEILVVHDNADDSDLTVADHGWEGYKLDSMAHRHSFREALSLERKKGEIYHLMWPTVQTSGSYRE